MNYLIVSVGLDYAVATLIENYKNNAMVELYTTKEKRKVKTEQQIYTVTTSDINEFIRQVEAISEGIDSDLLAEMLEDDLQKHSINELSTIYFGDKFSQIEETALLFKLSKQFTDFNNHLNGHFSKLSIEEREKRIAMLNKRSEATAQLQAYYNAFMNNEKPNFLVDTLRLINKPDKNSTEYKALAQSAKELGLTPIELCYNVGLIDNLAQFFIDSFMLDLAHNTSNITDNMLNVSSDDLPFNDKVVVFSIDDSTTTEIDDAFSVLKTETGYTVGIHIAAPALNPHLADIAANNISTIYYPGHKLAMLPHEVIEQYSLSAGKQIAVVSIYFNIDNDFNIVEYNSTVEKVTIDANLRIEQLELLFNAENLELEHSYPHENELKILYKFAQILEEKRGKASVNNLALDYSFSFDEDRVIVKPRIRGNPIDKLVSELMILANGTWGRMLTNAFIPAIYRVKQANYPVRMTLNPDSHVGLNVDYYTWATSPLRRASDYVNQYQIIKLVQGKKDFYDRVNPTLVEVVENFDIKYAKYIDFQDKMERYWSLYYLLQEQISELNAVFVYKSKVQLEGIPINIDTHGIILPKPKGSIIRVRVFNIKLANLTFEFKILEN